jgi:hypothetical protein
MKKLEVKLVMSRYNDTPEQNKTRDLYEDLGLNLPEENVSPLREELVNYTFMYESIIEYRQSLVSFKGEELPAIVCMYMHQGKVFQTPLIVITYEEFEKLLKENESN